MSINSNELKELKSILKSRSYADDFGLGAGATIKGEVYFDLHIDNSGDVDGGYNEDVFDYIIEKLNHADTQDYIKNFMGTNFGLDKFVISDDETKHTLAILNDISSVLADGEEAEEEGP